MDTWIEISKSALLNNFDIFCEISRPAQVAPILKSNAYGHGLAEIYSCLKIRSPKWIGVNYLFEAEAIRNLGFKGNIFIISPITHKDFTRAVKINAHIFMSSWNHLDQWITSSEKPNIHLVFDTGMSRLGFSVEELDKVRSTVENYKSFVHGLCSHFAYAEDVFDFEYADQQLKDFELLIKKFSDFEKLAFHMAASSATMLLPESRFDLSRVGVSLYGLWASESTKSSYNLLNDVPIELMPVLSWFAKVSLVKTVKKGKTISYGCRYKANKDMTIAVIPIGYYEGYPRHCGAPGYVLIRGQRCKIIGSICMNMLMVDVSSMPEVHVDDKVTLIGEDGTEQITAGLFADWAGTIQQEVLTSLKQNIKRIIVG